MKKQTLKLIAMFFIAAIISSCSGDDVPGLSGNEKLAAEQNATESNKISTTTLEEGVLISGASKQTGNPPAPNSNIDFQLKANNTALQKNGINIEFNSSVDVAGAYIRFKDVAGNGTESYFNVPASTFSNKRGTKTILSSRIRKEAKMVDSSVIDVDFTDVVPAGEFCYDICIYDSSNNISQIQTVCITVEAWGGNADLVGDWIYLGSSYESELETLDCNNGGTIENIKYYKTLVRDINVSFSNEGSYNDSISEESQELDWDETVSTCTPVYLDSEKNEIERFGNWAYDQRNNKISIVMFKYKDILTPLESYDIEEGELITDALIVKELTSDTLILEEVIDFAGLPNITYTFKRK